MQAVGALSDDQSQTDTALIVNSQNNRDFYSNKNNLYVQLLKRLKLLSLGDKRNGSYIQCAREGCAVCMGSKKGGCMVNQLIHF